jgi:hypothetical protein
MVGVKPNESEWVWDIDLEALVGCNAHIETKDGIKREGRISNIKMSSLVIGDEEVERPEALELNGDSGDIIGFDRLVRVDLLGG